MRILLAVDFEHYGKAAACLAALDFEGADIELLHVIESVLPDGSFPDLAPDHELSKIAEASEKEGREELARAEAMLSGSGARLTSKLLRGDAARTILETADTDAADLIAAGSARKGLWQSLFFGSVTRALTNAARQSFLIGKTAPSLPLRAVFATDHSEYADRCLDKLIAMKPRGLAGVRILRAVEQGGMESANAKNRQLCEKLIQAGIEADSALVEGGANEAIAAQMEETGAGLLILGARGKSMWERIGLGSVSTYQVVNTDFNVLVLRV